MTDEGFSERLRRTNAYYDRFAEQVTARIGRRDFSRSMDAFLSLLDKAKTILDVGCGDGGHLKEFQDRGYLVLGVEPSAAMRQMTEQKGVPVIDGAFETLLSLPLPEIGGVWLASSLLHVPSAEAPQALKDINQILFPGGPLFITVRLGSGASWDAIDKADGEDAARFIQLFSEEELFQMMQDAGFQVTEWWVEEAYWGRPSQWISVVGRKGVLTSTNVP